MPTRRRLSCRALMFVQICVALQSGMLGFVRVFVFLHVFSCTTYYVEVYGYYCIYVCFMFNKNRSINQSIIVDQSYSQAQLSWSPGLPPAKFGPVLGSLTTLDILPEDYTSIVVKTVFRYRDENKLHKQHAK